jgi:hypothetical protein
MTDAAAACPECGGKVVYDLACHTWPQTRPGGGVTFMSCMPCDSAIEYYCVAQYADDSPGTCAWEYTHGLNPRNPRSAANEAKRPAWIPEGLSVNQRAGGSDFMPLVLATALPGVPWACDREDD